MINSRGKIVPYQSDHLEVILELSIRAWNPVFPAMEQTLPDYVYQSFYPNGWKKRQLDDIAAVCREDETSVWVYVVEDRVAGYIGLRVHEEDSMGETYIIAVDPDFQRHGVGSALMDFGFDWMRERRLAMAMVETGGDDGHAPARKAYVSAGFEQIHVARYFRKL